MGLFLPLERAEEVFRLRVSRFAARLVVIGDAFILDLHRLGEDIGHRVFRIDETLVLRLHARKDVGHVGNEDARRALVLAFFQTLEKLVMLVLLAGQEEKNIREVFILEGGGGRAVERLAVFFELQGEVINIHPWLL